MRKLIRDIVIMGKNLSFAEQMQRWFDIAYWKMGEASGNLVDSSGHGFTAVAAGTGTTYQAETLPNGDKILTLDGNGYFNPFSAGLATIFNFNAGSFAAIIKIDSEEKWLAATAHQLINLRGVASKIIRIEKNISAGIQGYRNNNGNFQGAGRTDLLMLGMTWDITTGLLKRYIDGRRVLWNVSGQVDLTDTLSTTYTRIGTTSNTADDKWIGSMGHMGISSAVLNDSQWKTLYDKMFPSSHNIFIIGDSKATGTCWGGFLCNRLRAETGGTWMERPHRWGFGGYDISAMKVYVLANIGAETDVPEKIIINMGTNDARAVTITSQAIFEADYIAIIDALRAKWAGVPIYIAKIWRGDSETTIANSATINTYIDNIIAHYPSGVSLGLNEAVTLENGDAGVTYYKVDLVHPNAESQVLQANTWLAAMGY